MVRPLARSEKHAYYQVGQRLGRAFGIPAELMPPTYDDFECYVDAMLDSDALTVGPAARAVVAALFAPDQPFSSAAHEHRPTAPRLRRPLACRGPGA
jgi:uncharacterized protein (DUF2236 family)